MTEKFNGRFKLQSTTGVEAFYQAAGISQAEIDKFADFEDPSKGLELEQKIVGDDYSLEYHLGGKKVHEEKYKLNQERDALLDDVKYKIKTYVEGDKLIDITTRPGIKQTKYERSVDGNKLTVVMTSAELDLKAVREFLRV